MGPGPGLLWLAGLGQRAAASAFFPSASALVARLNPGPGAVPAGVVLAAGTAFGAMWYRLPHPRARRRDAGRRCRRAAGPAPFPGR
ncbi:hypothetical protein GCM10010517_10720 [Streptosporangium fragile]|uniref:Uncharacterized protein n=1 Tax=Streptosporangium fragile TaxID=46186 RepID=A0ABN3VRT1_9ACTN